MKKCFSFLLLMVIICSLIGCESEEKEEQLTAEYYLYQLQARTATITNIVEYTVETDENALMGKPNQYISKANACDSRLEFSDENNPSDVIVEVFENKTDAESRKQYLDSFTGMLASTTYQFDNVLLRLCNELNINQTKEYKKIMEDIIANPDITVATITTAEKIGSKSKPAKLNESIVVNELQYDDYKIEITLTEFKTGNNAWSIIKSSDTNKELKKAKNSQEYALAKLKIKVLETENDKGVQFSSYDFDFVSKSGITYNNISAFGMDDMFCFKKVYKGATVENYIFTLIEKDDEPFIVFNGSSDNNIWFSTTE